MTSVTNDPRQQVEAIVDDLLEATRFSAVPPPEADYIDQILALFDWIPVSSEEKPEENEDILQGYYDEDGKFHWARIRYKNLQFVFGTTHWQRIRPPQEKG